MDAGKVGTILSEFVDTTPWMPRIHTRAQDLAHAAEMIEMGWVTLAEQDAAVVAFMALHESELNALYVASGVRGEGVGSALLQHAQKVCRSLTLWTFQANTAAQRFYVRHGFREVLRTDGADNDEGLPDIRFDWHEGHA